jgi:hypothetical protein
MECKLANRKPKIGRVDTDAYSRNTLIESLSQQKSQGEDIAEIRENLRTQRAEQALSLLSMSITPLNVVMGWKLKVLDS